MADERIPTPRVVLMEFELPAEMINETDTPGVFAALVAQIGDANGAIPDPVTILVPVAEAEGGRIAVIEGTAKAAGKYRAPAKSGWTSRRGVPPSQQRLDFEDGD